jgi:hypothetical protein
VPGISLLPDPLRIELEWYVFLCAKINLHRNEIVDVLLKMA